MNLQPIFFLRFRTSFFVLLFTVVGLFSFSFPSTSLYGQAVNSQNSQVQVGLSSADSVLAMDIVPSAEEAQTDTDTLKTETPFFALTFAAEGGKITNFRHKDAKNPRRNLSQIAEPDPFWFNLYLTPKSFAAFKKARFELSEQRSEDRLTVTAQIPVEIVTDQGNIKARLEKIFIFFTDTHYYLFTWRLHNLSQKKIVIQNMNFLPITAVGPHADSLSPRAQDSYQNFYQASSKFKSYSIRSGHKSSFLSCSGNKSTTEEIGAPIDFFGMSSRFMVMAVQPMPATDKLIIFPPSGKNLPAEQQLQLAAFEVAPAGQTNLNFLIYTGPKVNDFVNVRKAPEILKKYPELKNVHDDITEAFNFGITAPIRDAIVWILKFLYKIYPNYGVGIILFALLLRILFYPINEMQTQSIEKMKTIQPLMKEINEKYKDDPQEKQKKTMELYQKNKVNPLGGCFPMLIQLPIFIALYSAFSDSYELWKSPFIGGWINDLSEPDTLFVLPASLPFVGGFRFHALPLIMAASQIIQTRMTAVSEDPNQKLMMQVMPLILLFIFWRMPSGVVLYWTIFNLLMIAQQLITKARNKSKK